jgi:hypothetical protein
MRGAAVVGVDEVRNESEVRRRTPDARLGDLRGRSVAQTTFNRAASDTGSAVIAVDAMWPREEVREGQTRLPRLKPITASSGDSCAGETLNPEPVQASIVRIRRTAACSALIVQRR